MIEFSTDEFSFDKDNLIFVAGHDSVVPRAAGRFVADGVAGPEFLLVSSKTKNKILFRFFASERDSEGKILFWEYWVSNDSRNTVNIMQNETLMSLKVRILND
jgi:hypothetical protein